MAFGQQAVGLVLKFQESQKILEIGQANKFTGGFI